MHQLRLKQLAEKFLPAKLKFALNSGSRFQCPFCGFRAKNWAPIGFNLPVLKEKQVVGGGIRAAGCYKCQSTDRERLIYLYLKEILNIFEHKNIKILHLAPEKNLSKTLYESGFEEYLCGDLFTKGYEYPEYVHNMNVLNLPFGDDFFDLIICNHLLEHVPDDSDAMRELLRVLKPDGKAILQVPISKNTYRTIENPKITTPRERKKAFGQMDHVRIYGQDYTERLASAGFDVERINISRQFEKFGLNPDEDIFVGTRISASAKKITFAAS